MLRQNRDAIYIRMEHLRSVRIQEPSVDGWSANRLPRMLLSTPIDPAGHLEGKVNMLNIVCAERPKSLFPNGRKVECA